MSKTKQRTTANAVEVLRHHFGDDAERQGEIERIKQDMEVGEQIHAARTAAGLTQAQLAKRIGTSQSIISDLEDAEYQGHTLRMLRRIAEALDMHVHVSFVPDATPREPVHA
jgi:ribosome-binding protein aMBF1 (putative translation factor)